MERVPFHIVGPSSKGAARFVSVPNAGGQGSADAPLVRARSVRKSYMSAGHQVDVLGSIDVDVHEGQFAGVVGPSGCGKTTFLNILAGLDRADAGTVAITEQGVTVGARGHAVGYMQQKDLLLPWRTVIENAVLPLEVGHVPARIARRRAMALLDQFGLSGFEHHYPHALSGGMRQRVAFLRTVLTDARLILLDEPFGALDALTRMQMQEWLLGLKGQIGSTFILVTHDVEEAILLSDRVYVFGARPATVRAVVDVPLPAARDASLVTTDAFVSCKRAVLAAVRSGPAPSRGEA